MCPATYDDVAGHVGMRLVWRQVNGLARLALEAVEKEGAEHAHVTRVLHTESEHYVMDVQVTAVADGLRPLVRLQSIDENSQLGFDLLLVCSHQCSEHRAKFLLVVFRVHLLERSAGFLSNQSSQLRRRPLDTHQWHSE